MVKSEYIYFVGPLLLPASNVFQHCSLA